jgi:hypothetical protein
VSGARRLRAPRDNGGVVASVPLGEVGRLVAANRQRLGAVARDFLGRSWQDLQLHARRETLVAARAYLLAGAEPVPDWDGTSLLMAGHQPDLCHPGVWVKNFALNGLARRHGGVPVNLVVDNDTVKAVGLHVPIARDPLPPVEAFQPRLTTIPFDRLANGIPFEERTVQDEELFATLPDRVPAEWSFEPMLRNFWTTVCKQASRTKLLGERMASARREWERRWGCHNLEMPVSRVSQIETFAWFACHLLADLPRFHSIYNDGVRSYRQVHGIRSDRHPVPDLATEGDWLETPFWAWRIGQTRRGRLMARRSAEKTELRVGDEYWPALPLGTEYSALSTQHSVSAWREFEGKGFKVRPRALTNTLFARLFLCDLFIHGIGGGKYDELTDEILHRFYGIEPPEFLVLSATLLLPFSTYPSRPDDCRRLAHELRDLRWNPQRHVDMESVAAKLALQKQAWIEQQPDQRRDRREQFRVLRELTEHLRSYTEEREHQLHEQLNRCEQEVQANTVLQRRDYPFCLYPELLLRRFCTQFLEVK